MADSKDTDKFGLNIACIDFGDGNKLGANETDVLKILEVRPTPRANLTQSTLASGKIVYDSKVVMPTEIVCKCSLEIDKDSKWKTVLSTIEKSYNRIVYADSTKYATIQSKTSVYKNCSLQSCPHVESPEFGDLFYFDLRFTQMIFATVNGIVNPSSAADSDAAYMGNV